MVWGDTWLPSYFIATELVDTFGIFISSEFYMPDSSDLLVFATKLKAKY